jgi:hypothetical protein
MDNQASNSSRATFVLVVILILLGALAAVWYSGHVPGAPRPVGGNANNQAAQERERLMSSLPEAKEDAKSAAERQALLRSLDRVKVGTSASAAAERQALLQSLPPVK